MKIARNHVSQPQVRSAMALAFVVDGHGLPLERSQAGGPDDLVFRERLHVGDAAALHDSAGPDVARAGGHGCSRPRLTHTLRLTGAVAYNAFKTTPVITQVGGPVSRILVVPGHHVKAASRCSR